MAFELSPASYDAFMGRWSVPLADRLVARLDLAPGARVLDVGCGPGALTARLAQRVGASSVAAVDPMPHFVAAVQERVPGVDARVASAERLPFPDGGFDACVAQLVVHFMRDPAAGFAEMRRVCRRGGLVGASVWDHAGGRGPVSPFWVAVRSFEPGHPGEDHRAGSAEGDLVALASAAGLSDVTGDELGVTLGFASFEEWWQPFPRAAGPVGDYLAGLHERGVVAVREACRDRLGPGPFELTVAAWYAQGVA